MIENIWLRLVFIVKSNVIRMYSRYSNFNNCTFRFRSGRIVFAAVLGKKIARKC